VKQEIPGREQCTEKFHLAWFAKGRPDYCRDKGKYLSLYYRNVTEELFNQDLEVPLDRKVANSNLIKALIAVDKGWRFIKFYFFK
jgi:hypothetical protein